MDTWDLSLLIDPSTKIHDARGMTSEHFGVALREMTRRSFIDFVSPEQRAAFRRCMARIAGGNEMRMMAAKLLTCEPEPRQFYMTAKRSGEPDRWWLMIATESAHVPSGVEQLSTSPVLAEDGEFIAMVEAAASQMSGQADLMRVTSALLAGGQDNPRVAPAVKDELETSFNKIVLDSAVDGIATRQSPGEYVLLKDRETPDGEITGQLEAAAEQLSVSRADLGLEAASVGLDKLGGKISGENIAKAMSDLATGSSAGRDAWGEPVPQKSWIKRAIAAVGFQS